ncbi:hypothetical protein COX24_02405 [bacterium (Candidatus Gribaldobacteria) CG23_combo_of_CG06-09_8_20_14_all_37_87_8]|uniref:Uncharacterized protein n=1 Tax=bacterium (Candidatus Gribaldobacteria) CG23_combo_of_CG06-09_8_20_14_all_37_87_8 TaxID=2014278 RepID=A0A2G9ZEQ8_9BACT|nr:MAG: hypothetical protein COX24_02405 [bacterium (Candidatus Gribaldobacteria) CG23_combo_of_CG06-09_8_20_14_all_37_87_8]
MKKINNLNLLFVVLMVFAVLTILPSSVKGANPPENILPNPYFEEGITGWTIDAARAVLSIDQKEKSPTGTPVMKVTVNAVGAENWEPEVHSPSFNLTMGKTYTYAIFIKAEPDSVRTLGVNFEQLDTWVGMGQEITLTDEWVEYHFTGVWANASSPPAVVIHIGVNLQKDDFWLSYCRVYEGKFVQEEFGEIPQAVDPMPKSAKLASTWGKIKNDA